MSSKVQPQLSLHLLNFAPEGHTAGWGHLLALARACDAAGIDRGNVSDHVVYGEALDEYAKPEVGGREGGQQPTGPDGQWLDPLTTLAVIAGQTKSLRLGTQILLAALRRPVTLAKAAATLDQLSGGRLDIGVGVGWQKAEYDAAGLSFEKRGRLLDHTLEVLEALWTQTRSSYSSPELTFDGIHQHPKPIDPAGVPLWISGTIKPPTVRRLIRYGYRWIPWGKDDGDMLQSLPQMKDAIGKAGGNPDLLRSSGPLPVVWADRGVIDLDRTMEKLPALIAAGQSDFMLPFYEPDVSKAEAKLRPIVAAFRAATGRPQVD